MNEDEEAAKTGWQVGDRCGAGRPGLQVRQVWRLHRAGRPQKGQSQKTASSWGLLYRKTPKRQDSVSCSVCVLIMIELTATEGAAEVFRNCVVDEAHYNTT